MDLFYEQTFSKISMFLISALMFCTMGGCSKKEPVPADAQIVHHDLEPQSKQKVLVLHSYNSEFEWVCAINRGISLVLSSNPDIEIQHFYMDTKRHTDNAWKHSITAKTLKFIETWQPDIVIASDDNAQDLVGRKFAGQDKPAWVFCGVNNEPQEYGYPAKNVTGVLERLHLLDSLAFFKQINPAAQKVLFVSDNSPTSTAVIKYCKKVNQSNPSGLEIVDWVMPVTMNEWKQTILDYNDKVDAFAIYTYHTVKPDESSTPSVAPKEVMGWTSQNSIVPIIGFLSFTIEDGAFCGVFESGIEQGQIAGEMALDIIHGKSPANIPMTTATQGQSAINMNIAQQLHIPISDEILQSTYLIIDDQ